MCILSIVRKKNQFILTHNRDEDVARTTSRTLITENKFDVRATFPMDEMSGGTWVLTSKLWSTAILNGALENHKRNPPYRHSRGIFPFMLLEFDNIENYVQSLDLSGIEPFTQVIFNHDSEDLYVLYWDEKEINLVHTEEDCLVLSSAPLYSQKEKEYHKKAIANLKNPTADELALLHKELAWEYNKDIPMLKTTSQVQIVANLTNKYMKFNKFSK